MITSRLQHQQSNSIRASLSANAIQDALRRDGALTAATLDLVEINEAFVSVSDLVRNPRPCTTGIDNVGLLRPAPWAGARIVSRGLG